MRVLITIALILISTLIFSQTKASALKVDLKFEGLYERIIVKLDSEKDSISNCSVSIIDAKKILIKKVDLPKAYQHIESTIGILNLLPGNYTCLVYKGKEELYRKDFFKDDMFIEQKGNGNIRPKN